jgi:hypothetical protein
MNDVAEAFCGIDVACAKGKRLPIAVCVKRTDGLKSLPLRSFSGLPPRGMGNRNALSPDVRRAFCAETRAYLAEVERAFDVRISRVAIDAPRAPAQSGRRQAERAMDRLGISCIATPNREQFARLEVVANQHLLAGGSESRIPGANQIWMLVGFSLFVELQNWYPCIEVFPNAIVNALVPGVVHKSRADGLTIQTQAIATAAEWNPSELALVSYGSRHDKLDALMSAWIASLPDAQRIAHGDGGDDTIWSVRPFA